jgi:D-aminoacyl-tRNA deacylase
MRAVIQRAKHATVSINGTINGSIGSGLLVLLGIEHADTEEDINWMCSKLCNLRIFSDDKGLMNLSVKDIQGQILLVSQFTLFASTQKGNRPSYIRSARPEQAIPLYQSMVNKLEQGLGKPISTGVFGANMQVSLINDGPVTIIMDSKQKE